VWGYRNGQTPSATTRWQHPIGHGLKLGGGQQRRRAPLGLPLRTGVKRRCTFLKSRKSAFHFLKNDSDKKNQKGICVLRFFSEVPKIRLCFNLNSYFFHISSTLSLAFFSLFWHKSPPRNQILYLENKDCLWLNVGGEKCKNKAKNNARHGTIRSLTTRKGEIT